MQIFSKRPLLCACMLFLLTIVSGYLLIDYIDYEVLIVLITIGIISVISLWTLCGFKHLRPYSCTYATLSIVSVLFALVISFSCFGIRMRSAEKFYDQNVTIEAYITETKASSANFYTYEIAVSTVNGENVPHRALLICPYDCALEPGSAFTALVCGKEFTGKFGGMDQKLSMMSDGIIISYISEESSTMLISDENAFDLNIFFSNINQKLTRIFLNNTDKTTAGLSAALLLGNRDHVPDEVTRNFARSGASHTLSLSGMHMSIILGVFMLLLKRIRMNHRLIAVILSVCAIIYLCLTGFSLAATRSVLMLLSTYLCILFFAESDALTALGLAAAIIVGITPYSILDAGFWMSFTATLGLLVYMNALDYFVKAWIETLSRFRAIWRVLWNIASLFLASIFAMIPLLIIMCIFIKEISIYTIYSTACLTLPTAGMILFSLLFLPLHNIPVISQILRTLLEEIAHHMIDLTSNVASWKGTLISLNYPFTYIFMFGLAIALILSLAMKFKTMARSLIPFAAVLLLFVCFACIYETSMSNTVKTTYLNVSAQSDMLVVSNNREVIICDIGNGSSESYDQAMEAAQNARATEIKAIVLTKYSHKHSATLLKIFAREYVKELWAPYPDTEDEYYKLQALAEYADRFDVDLYIYKNNERMFLFEFVSLSVTRTYIERSVVPITLLNISGRQDRLSYISPGFNESVVPEETYQMFSKTDFFIFGSRGPKTQTVYTLPNLAEPRLVIFADDKRIAYYEDPKLYGITYVKVPASCDIYMDK